MNYDVIDQVLIFFVIYFYLLRNLYSSNPESDCNVSFGYFLLIHIQVRYHEGGTWMSD